MAGRTDDEEDKPLDPAAEALRQRLVRFMVINLVVVFGLVFIVVGILVYRYMRTESVPPQVADVRPPEGEGVLTGRIGLPAGARVVSQSLSGERLSVAAELADGSTAIFIYDTRLARITARFDVTVAP